MHRQAARLSKRWFPYPSDALLAFGVCAGAIAFVYLSPLGEPSGFARPGDLLGALIAVGMTVPLAWRRDRPIVTLVIVALFSGFSNLRNYATDPAQWFSWFALGSAAFYTNRRQSAFIALGATAFELYWNIRWDLPSLVASDMAWGVVVGVVPVLLGDALRRHRAASLEIVDRERRLHELQASSAAESERLRIARELHDIVGHHLSAIAVHARATALLVHDQPARAAEELERLGQLAARALSETKQSVGALRLEPSNIAPQPRLDELDDLATVAQTEGVDIQIQRVGPARPLLDSIELCGYRIVQEALTNVVKHAARPASAEVTIDYQRSQLEITVTSRSAEPTAPSPGRGFGLAGMRERVSLSGGSLDAGPIDPRTWVVRASLPALDSR